MRIVNKKEMLEIPGRVLYAPYKKHFSGPLVLKIETIDLNDWIMLSLSPELLVDDDRGNQDSFEVLESMFSDGNVSAPCDFDCYGRHGYLGDGDEKFIIFEKADIAGLIEKLKGVL